MKYTNWVKRYLSRGRWLGKENKFVINRVSGNIATPKDRKHLGEYIASTIPLHLYDGWTYLGQALTSYVRGASGLSIHLGYYAELRAAMSLLSAQGIAVFNFDNYVVFDSGEIKRLNKGLKTHDAAWLFVENWAKQQDSADYVGQIIAPRSISLVDWINIMPGVSNWKPLGEDMLLGFGLDLKNSYEDRRSRNRVTYRPTTLHYVEQEDIKDRIYYAIDLIRSLQPVGKSGELHVDQYILRLVIERAFQSTTGLFPSQSYQLYQANVKAMLDRNIQDQVSRNFLDMFLLRIPPFDFEPDFLIEAGISDPTVSSKLHLQVLGRAALLLRVATGATRDFMNRAGIKLSDVDFWWNDIGVQIGLAEHLQGTVNALEVWPEIVLALDEMDEWLDDGGDALGEFFDVFGASFNLASNLGIMSALSLPER